MVELEAKQGSAVSKSTGENCEKNSDCSHEGFLHWGSRVSAMCCQPSADSPSSSLPGSFPLSVLYLHESTRLCLSAGTNLSLCLQWNLSNADTIEPL